MVRQRTSPPLLTVLCLLCALLLCSAVRAQTPGSNTSNQVSAAPAAPVPIKNEPHHRLVLKNDFVNVYNVLVPPLDATLLHQHDLPYIGVTLGRADLVNVVSGKPETRLTLQDETRYFSERYSHLVRTDSGLPFWNITVEFLRPQGIARNLCKQVIEGPLACPQQAAAGKKNSPEAAEDEIPCFETEEMRIDQIKVAGGRDYVEDAPKLNSLLIALSNANLDVNLGGQHISFLHDGDIQWLPAGTDRKVVDFLGTKSSFLLVSFKDSASGAKP